MTINQLVECALGKECCISGEYGDATPFTEGSTNVADKLIDKMNENTQKSLQNYGFQPQGWETMYNAMTGEVINAKIFIGPTYYQRLKHMVDDKMHARAHGHVTSIVRQPCEGEKHVSGYIHWSVISKLKFKNMLYTKIRYERRNIKTISYRRIQR